MERLWIKIPYESRSDKYNIIPLGDIHLGNKGCDKQRLRDMISWIKDAPNCYWIGMGDYIDCINYTDKRFDPSTIDNKYLNNLSNCVPMQTEDIIHFFEPIKDKCLGLHRGNHEEKIRLTYHYDVMYEIGKTLDIPLLEDSALIRLSFMRKGGGHEAFDIFSIHGRVGGRKGGNKINWLEDCISYINADIYLMAHSHIKEAEIKTQLYGDQKVHIRQKKKVLGVTGSFLRGYTEESSSYTEKWMLPPTDIGVIKLTLIPNRRDIHVSL
jgi:hypothetical protein